MYVLYVNDRIFYECADAVGLSIAFTLRVDTHETNFVIATYPCLAFFLCV